MSCFRCGKELPGMQIECEPPCDEPVMDGIPVPPGFIALMLQINLNRKEIAGDQMEFCRASRRFNELFALAIMESGLAKFCQRITPPPKKVNK